MVQKPWSKMPGGRQIETLLNGVGVSVTCCRRTTEMLALAMILFELPPGDCAAMAEAARAIPKDRREKLARKNAGRAGVTLDRRAVREEVALDRARDIRRRHG